MGAGIAFEFTGKAADRSEVKATIDGLQFALDIFNVASARARARFIQQMRATLDDLGVETSEPELSKELLNAYLAFQAQREAQEALKGDDHGEKRLEPWPDPVDGASLLSSIAQFLDRYCVLPPRASQAIALWVLHTYCYRLYEVSPRLALTSPVMRCGKTTLLTVLEALVADPLPGAVLTGPAVFHAIEEHGPTVLIDEFDLSGGANNELRAVLNAGHRANGQVPRVRKTYRCFSPVAFALILDPLRPVLPATLRDRSIEIKMVRKTSTATVESFRLARAEQEAIVLRRRCMRWAEDNALSIMETVDRAGELPLDDRARDNWGVLLGLAQVAGGDWPEDAREAAIALSASRAEDDEPSVQLLLDIKRFFDAAGVERTTTRDLMLHLQGLEEATWSDLTAQLLARRLRPFDIRPRTLRIGTAVAKGYYRQEFEKAWAAYLPTLGETP